MIDGCRPGRDVQDLQHNSFVEQLIMDHEDRLHTAPPQQALHPLAGRHGVSDSEFGAFQRGAVDGRDIGSPALHPGIVARTRRAAITRGFWMGSDSGRPSMPALLGSSLSSTRPRCDPRRSHEQTHSHALGSDV